MPAPLRPAAEHRKINHLICRVQLEGLRLWYAMEAVCDDRKKDNREDREFVQNERVSQRPSGTMASSYFLKREAKRNRPLVFENPGDIDANFIFERENRHF